MRILCLSACIQILAIGCSKVPEPKQEEKTERTPPQEETTRQSATIEYPAQPITNGLDAAFALLEKFSESKPLSELTLTNNFSQNTILAILDPVNVRHEISAYFDGYCGFGARLSRYYVGENGFVVVSFAWDREPKRTMISLYGNEFVSADSWYRELTNAVAKGD